MVGTCPEATWLDPAERVAPVLLMMANDPSLSCGRSWEPLTARAAAGSSARFHAPALRLTGGERPRSSPMASGEDSLPVRWCLPPSSFA